MSSIVRAIKRTHEWGKKNDQPVVFWAIDLHGTIIKPDYGKNKPTELYPYAEECLQYLSKDRNNVLILFSSTWPDELATFQHEFKQYGINFKYRNKNPEVETNVHGHGYYFDKFYFNVMLEDKAGFEPETDWKEILDYMKARDE